MNTAILIIWAAFGNDGSGIMSVTPARAETCHKVQALVSQSPEAVAKCVGSAREVAHIIDAGHCKYVTEDDDGQHYACRNRP